MKTLGFAVMLGFVLVAGCDTTPSISDAPEDRFFLQSDGAIMPVRVRGNIESDRFLIFLHGGPGGNMVDVRDLVDEAFAPIEENVAVVYWDQRCAGSSQGSCDPAQLSFEAYERDLDRLVTVLEHRYGDGIELSLLGHSWGGWFAAHYLSDPARGARFSRYINAAGAHNGPLVFSSGKAKMLAAADRQIGAGRDVQAWQDLRTAVLDADVSTHAGRTTINEQSVVAADLMAGIDSVNTPSFDVPVAAGFASFNGTMGALVNALLSTNSAFVERLFTIRDVDRLANIQIPVLLLWGDYDYTVPDAMRIEFEEMVGSKSVQTVRFHRSGHAPMVTEQAAFADAVVTFMSSPL